MNSKLLTILVVLCLVVAALAMSPAHKVKGRMSRPARHVAHAKASSAMKAKAASAQVARKDADYVWATLVEAKAKARARARSEDDDEEDQDPAQQTGPVVVPPVPDPHAGDIQEMKEEDEQVISEFNEIECTACADFVGQLLRQEFGPKKDEPHGDICTELKAEDKAADGVRPAKVVCDLVKDWHKKYPKTRMHADKLCGTCPKALEIGPDGEVKNNVQENVAATEEGPSDGAIVKEANGATGAAAAGVQAAVSSYF